MRARKKPVEVEFFQFEGTILNNDYEWVIPDWAVSAVKAGIMYFDEWYPEGLCIETDTGVSTADYGDYIIKETQGEIYPCKKEVFEEVYEVIEECQSSFKDWIDDVNQFVEEVRRKEH